MELLRVPSAAEGPLSGLTFAVKDLIDIAGRRTGGGHPKWRDTHPPAHLHALVVSTLLAAGAECVGVLVSDEMAASFSGENPFFGNPINPAAPGHTCGGSSSGSASAVAHGFCDFSLGTDTGGSVRVPASNCGIYGWRPTYGVLSLSGVNPLAPSYDTVGVLARDPRVLTVAGRVLLGDPTRAQPVRRVLRVSDTFDMVDDAVREGLAPALERVREKYPLEDISLRELTGLDFSMSTWEAVFGCLESEEISVALGPWLLAERPEFGPVVGRNLANLDGVPPPLLEQCWRLRRAFTRALHAKLSDGTLLCIPTVCAPPPRFGSFADEEFAHTYSVRLLSLCAIAGNAGIGQVTLPLGVADGLPVGLSLIAGPGRDTTLFDAAVTLQS